LAVAVAVAVATAALAVVAEVQEAIGLLYLEN
jgi:hypothetical protein